MAKGLWRIDYVALAELGNRVEPIIIKPSSSSPQNINSSNVVELLTNADSLLVTYPGDRYFLNYKLPSDFTEYELFMESQGYYLEWMRNEWLGDQEHHQQLITNGFGWIDAGQDLAGHHAR